ncbi:MAG: FG-GAP repeat protein, partial [Actinobacteria bacterium]|nr:FG-GAP repeat protein [Actinomycetota bacterium]
MLITTIAVSTAAAQQPGLPRTYDAQRIDSPNPIGGGSFGWGISSADLTGDGKLDLLVAQSQTGRGQVFVYDGATGQNIDTIDPPERNTANANGSIPDEVLSFVYIETMPDIGSCAAGDGPDADKLCDQANVGPGDGIPEILAGARSFKVNGDNNNIPAAANARQIGRGYVIDGRTRAVLKRIDMPREDRLTQEARSASPQFGRVMISPQAMAPCAGLASENNNAGVGPCPFTPQAVRIGDLDGGGQPDIVITARSFSESAGPAGSAAPGSDCKVNATAGNCSAGKAWAYSGEAIAGSPVQDILDTAMFSVQNPDAQGGTGSNANGSTEFGGNLLRIGDVNGDGRPEFVIPSRNADYPLRRPDPTFRDVGAAYLVNGASYTTGNPPAVTANTTAGAVQATYISPEPQPRSQFSGNFNGGRAPGDLGSNSLPDLMLPSPLQNGNSPDEGRVYVFNGEPNGAGGGAQGSFHFATLRDPEPKIGGNFGGGISGVGDLVGGLENPANEVIVGGFTFDPFTEASQSNITSLRIMNAQTERTLLSIPDPDQARGSGFGVGITPMGDLNGDGKLDIAASSYLYNGVVAGQGRAYIFRSNDTPLPEPPAAPPPAAPPAAAPPAASETAPATPPVATATRPTSAFTALRPGSCKNERTGTSGPDRLRGT